MNDYAAWLTQERLEIEERLWAECRYYEWYATAILELGPTSVVELGCGTGWVPYVLPASTKYVGVDSNAQCVNLARAKNPGRLFVEMDLRRFRPQTAFDIVCAFAVVKHFALDEVGLILQHMGRCGRLLVFTVPPAEEDFDDGVEFPHIHLSSSSLARLVQSAGRRIVTSRLLPNEELLVIAA
jgi:SAM-dependent methyltransferase